MRKCILIVDDNASVRRMLRTMFEDVAGWEICGEAKNGRDAIEKAGKSKPDLIVLDLAMPIMNGLEAAPVLRQMLPTVPIVMFTLYTNKFLVHAALSAGVTAVVSKDATENTLLSQAKDLLKTV